MSTNEIAIVPSLPAPSFSTLLELTRSVEGVVSTFQIDLVDGRFVPHRSWPFTEPRADVEWQRIAELPATLRYEYDCMVMQPEQYVSALAAFNPLRIIIHYGSTEAWAELQAHAAAHQYDLGVAITNDVDPAALESLITHGVTFVQVMGIAQVGAQGQPFDERTPKTIRALRACYPDITIAVDGSVNEQTAPRLVSAGATQLAPGSAVAKAADPEAAVAALRAATA